MVTSLSPLDGRYAEKTKDLSPFFSEKALLFYRLLVEINWFQYLAERSEIEELRSLTNKEREILARILKNFSEEDALRIKEIEATTKHDVKAVEYFLKEKLAGTSLEDVAEWIHFACTSEDINNLAYSLMLKDAMDEVMMPAYDEILHAIETRAKEWKNIPLLALTHGQPASPTTLGKAFFLFASRMSPQMDALEHQDFLGKINGATGNFNAHIAAYPKAPWLEISQEFVESLGLTWNPITDQIESHDYIAEISNTVALLNTILIDFSRDSWGYISRGIFKQKTRAGEIGSSTMPHKVNPIDFENAEGNFGIANALFRFFAEKLPVSRFQRDLTDSTILRNVGVAFGHSLLALKSLKIGIEKLEVVQETCSKELNANVEVLGEAAQTVMRKHGIEKPYEKLKELTRGKRITIEDFRAFVGGLNLPEKEKKALQMLTPETYIGLAAQMVEKFATPDSENEN
ncbi:MAG: adenylosuccinate lyase [Candidatus Peregrinibacteria bacterium]